MSRGSATPFVTSATPATLSTVFNASTDGPARTFEFEAPTANTDRIAIQWTDIQGRVNFLSIGPGGIKQISGGTNGNGIALIQIQSASASQSLYADLLVVM